VWLGTPGEYSQAKTWLKDHLALQTYALSLFSFNVASTTHSTRLTF
jgi:hypothetical protein